MKTTRLVAHETREDILFSTWQTGPIPLGIFWHWHYEWRWLPTKWKEFSSWLVPEAEDLDAVQSLNFSSLVVTWPGGTAWISWGSCGRYLRGELCTWQEPMQERTLVGLAAETQGSLFITIMKFIWQTIPFFQRPPPQCWYFFLDVICTTNCMQQW